MLTKHDFESALAKYPNVAEKVLAVATERANVVVLTDVIVNDSLFEGKSKSETAETLFEVSSQGLLFNSFIYFLPPPFYYRCLSLLLLSVSVIVQSGVGLGHQDY